MTTTNSYNRQPTKQDYADPTKFKFSILKLPKVEYFCTQVNLPGISLADNYSTTNTILETYLYLVKNYNTKH